MVQIQRLDFLQRQHAWEKEQLRAAPSITQSELDEEDDVYDLPVGSTNADSEEELDKVLKRENEEVEALLEYMPVPGPPEQPEMVRQQEVNLWSDDDDYDALFSDLMNDRREEDVNLQQGQDADGDDTMDLS